MMMMRKSNNQIAAAAAGVSKRTTTPRRLLITVSFIGSVGPFRFLVNEDELVAAVIQTALRNYAREGRFPALGSDHTGFLLYCANSGSDALSPWETIGSTGVRNFVLCRQPADAAKSQEAADGQTLSRKSSGSWKTWLNRSLNFKISSH